MGIPVSSTGPIPENFISLSSRVGVQPRGKVATLWTPLDSGPETAVAMQNFVVIMTSILGQD